MKFKYSLFIIIFSIFTGFGFSGNNNKDIILKTAKEIIKSSNYCILITTGSDGFPNARMMNPFPPDIMVWFVKTISSARLRCISLYSI